MVSMDGFKYLIEERRATARGSGAGRELSDGQEKGATRRSRLLVLQR
jgi:hypothetical protein